MDNPNMVRVRHRYRYQLKVLMPSESHKNFTMRVISITIVHRCGVKWYGKTIHCIGYANGATVERPAT